MYILKRVKWYIVSVGKKKGLSAKWNLPASRKNLDLKHYLFEPLLVFIPVD